VWNASADRTPALVALCSETADVQRALAAAVEIGAPIALRSGGHSVAGFSTCDDGVVIDLRNMRTITVDPEKRFAHAGPGATLGEFDRATQEHGLATTLGIVSMTGIAGLTLGGGLGWLMRKHGLACDNLLSAEVVLADGTVVSANADDDPELLWGLKGGGGNFGVVTSLEYRLHPVGPMVYGGPVAYPTAAGRDLLRFYREFTSNAPDELTTYAAFTAAPDGSPVAALAACHCGDLGEAERILAPAQSAAGSPLADSLGPLPYLEVQSRIDASYPSGQYHYWRSCFLDELTDEVIEILVDHSNASPAPPLLEIVIEQMGGAIRAGDGAFAHRDAGYDVLIDANWIDPDDGDRCVGWARRVAAALEPYARGGYVNYEPDPGQETSRSTYGRSAERLRTLKSKYDPDNVFRLNQNIASTQ
ncbi:MAG: FAD-binding oxidoreductase, partial [Actinomycetota bacterium]|nr:FAD-binding oxidoreductase [Actinomycetota bacterium]